MIWKNVTGERTERTIVLKILINYAQTLSFIGGFDYIWTFSSEILSMFQIFSATNFSVSVFTIHCAIQWNQYQKFVFYMIAPVIGGLFILGLFVVRYILESRKTGVYANFLKTQEWRYTKTTGLVFFLLVHPTLTQQIFQIFNCTDFAGDKYLADDYSLSCDTPLYKTYRDGAIAMIFVYVIGIPALGFTILFFNRDKLETESVKRKYRFLFEGYSANAYFWEFVIIVRKILLVAVVVFLKEAPFKSVYAGVWLLGIALMINVWVQPFEKSTLQLLETSSLAVLFCSLLLGMLSFEPDYPTERPEQLAVSALVIIINVIMAAVLLCCLSYHYYNVILQNKYVRKFMDRYKYRPSSTFTAADHVELENVDNGTGKPGTGIAAGDADYVVRGPITADRIKRGRENYRLEFSEKSISDGFSRSPR